MQTTMTLAVFAALALLSSAAPRQKRQAWEQSQQSYDVGTSGSDPRAESFPKMTDEEQVKFLARSLPAALAIAFSPNASDGDKVVEIANAFLPAARSIVEERASEKGRSITPDESETLQVTEEIVPILMRSIIEIFTGINNAQ